MQVNLGFAVGESGSLKVSTFFVGCGRKEDDMNQELTRIVDNIARDKNIDKESIYQDLEAAMVSAIRKSFGKDETESDIVVTIDRLSGEISAFKDEELIDIRRLGRIPAQTAKQVMIQKIKADERDSIFAEFVSRKGEIVNGTVARFEGGSLIVSLSRVEGIMPRAEQISGETHHPGERIRSMILDVRDAASQVKIILSRTHPEFIRRLFELEVPEVAEGIIEIKALAREAGYRTKIAVHSHDDKVDAVGACVGVRGSRIRNIVDELGGEKIDIVRWSDSSQSLIANGLKPAEVSETAICFELGRATVVVTEDQLSLAIGKHGQNVRLAARLTGWDIDILTPLEYNREVERLEQCLKDVEGVDDSFVGKLLALGIISVLDLEEVGVEPLVEELQIEESLGVRIVKAAAEEAKKLAAEKGRKQAEDLMAREGVKQGEAVEAQESQETEA